MFGCNFAFGQPSVAQLRFGLLLPRPAPARRLSMGSKASWLCQLVWPLSFARRSPGVPLPIPLLLSLSLCGPNLSLSLFLVFLSFPFSSSRFAHFHVFVGLTNRVNAISWLYVFWPLPLASKTSNICPCIMFKLNAHTFTFIYVKFV